MLLGHPRKLVGGENYDELVDFYDVGGHKLGTYRWEDGQFQFETTNVYFAGKLIRSGEFARGRIGFFIPNGSRLSAKTNLEDIVNAIEFDDYKRMVYANPEYAPYGAAAVQALHKAGVWNIDKAKLLMGENAAQALRFSLAGGVDIAIIPSSYAVLPKVKDQGRFIMIPEQWHKPIKQYLALLSDSNPSAEQFYEYLLSPDPQIILAKYGYTTSPPIKGLLPPLISNV